MSDLLTYWPIITAIVGVGYWIVTKLERLESAMRTHVATDDLRHQATDAKIVAVAERVGALESTRLHRAALPEERTGPRW